MFTITQLDMIVEAAKFTANHYNKTEWLRMLGHKYIEFADQMRKTEGGQDFNRRDIELIMNCTGRYLNSLEENAPEYNEFYRIHNMATNQMIATAPHF